MMPRFSPPTAIGLPRSRGSAACSTDAKNASASRWTMALDGGTFHPKSGGWMIRNSNAVGRDSVEP